MAKAAVIRLITKSRKAHGVHESTTDTARLILCTVKNVRQTEYYEGHNAGFRPEKQFDLSLADDYHGEGSLIFEGQEYTVIRTFEPKTGGLEIIAGRSDRNEPNDTDGSDGGQDPGDD